MGVGRASPGLPLSHSSEGLKDGTPLRRGQASSHILRARNDLRTLQDECREGNENGVGTLCCLGNRRQPRRGKRLTQVNG